jgi:hypothetical protein
MRIQILQETLRCKYHAENPKTDRGIISYREILCEAGTFTELAQDRIQWQDFVNTPMNIRVS